MILMTNGEELFLLCDLLHAEIKYFNKNTWLALQTVSRTAKVPKWASMCIPWGGITIMWPQESADFLWMDSQVIWLLSLRVMREQWGRGSSATECRTEKEQSLPLTGPMYITSEARMEKERVRERRRGQVWRDRYKQEMDGFNRTDEESTVRTVGKVKKYRTGKSYSPSRGIPNNST